MRSASRVRRFGLICVATAFAGVFAACSMPARAAEGPQVPPRAEALNLISATLAAIDSANRTGDYSALRTTAAPDFQNRFDPRAVAALFSEMRAKNIDFALAASLEPRIEMARLLTDQNVLQFYGTAKAAAADVRFLFSYQLSGGSWKLYALALDFDQARRVKASPAL